MAVSLAPSGTHGAFRPSAGAGGDPNQGLATAEEGGRGFTGARGAASEAAGGEATLTGVGVAIRLGLFFLSGNNGKLRMTRVTSPGVDSISM